MNPEVIITNIKKRYSGVSGTINALLPVQARSLKVGFVGTDLPGAALAEPQLGIGQVRRTGRQGRDIKPLRRGQGLADPGAVKPVIAVGRVIRGGQASSGNQLRQFRAAPTQQGADQRQARTRHQSARAHPGQTRRAAAAIEPQQQGFGLIVGGMAQENI